MENLKTEHARCNGGVGVRAAGYIIAWNHSILFHGVWGLVSPIRFPVQALSLPGVLPTWLSVQTLSLPGVSFARLPRQPPLMLLESSRGWGPAIPEGGLHGIPCSCLRPAQPQLLRQRREWTKRRRSCSLPQALTSVLCLCISFAIEIAKEVNK